MGGCQKVIETTKAFGQLKNFHTLDSKGIVDRDRRTQGEISYLREQNILVPDVAEVENLLMIEMVIKTVARRLMKNPEEVFVQVKENVIRLFEKDLDAQVILHAKHRVRKKLETTTDRKINTVEELAGHVEMIEQNIHVYEIYEEIKTEFESYISSANYPQILRVYNQKGMLPQSRLCSIIGINNKESYLNLILSILKDNKEDAVAIRLAIKESLGA
jgi:adenylate kinase